MKTQDFQWRFNFTNFSVWFATEKFGLQVLFTLFFTRTLKIQWKVVKCR